MADLASTQKISSNSSSFNNAINIQNQNSAPKQTQLNAKGDEIPAGMENPADISAFYKDSFSSTNSSGRFPVQKNSNNPFLKQSAQITGNINENLIRMAATVKSGKTSVINSFNKFQMNTQQLITNFLSRFVDIMDKISAVYGDKEKDIREKLSDTFNRMVQKIYDPLAPVDTEFEKEEHNREKQTKDNEDEALEEENYTKTHRID